MQSTEDLVDMATGDTAGTSVVWGLLSGWERMAHAEGGVSWRLGWGEVWEPGGPSSDRVLGIVFLQEALRLSHRFQRAEQGPAVVSKEMACLCR